MPDTRPDAIRRRRPPEPSRRRSAPRTFVPAWWLRNRHAQTIFAGLLRPWPGVRYRRQRLELPDGDFADLDWARDARPAGPIAVLLPGLEGSSASPYVAGMARALALAGWRPVVLHFRGSSGRPNRRAVSYHSGWTGDLAHLLERLAAREPATPLAAVGFSLGGNVLLKHLGETGAGSRLAAAAAVSVPYELDRCAAAMSRGWPRVYQRYLVGALKRGLAEKRRRMAVPVDARAARAARTFRAFDDAVTAPLHGFRDAADYYARASCRPYLGAIRVPTLLVHASDDPLTDPAVIPDPGELPPVVRLERSERGGHVGFVAGPVPWRPRYHLEERVPAWLERIPDFGVA